MAEEHAPHNDAPQPVSPNIVWQGSAVSRQDRMSRNGHRSCTVWLTGLSGAGKSTLAFALEKALFVRSVAAYVLDGDNVRHGLNRDLGFSKEDRAENIRRIGEVSKLFADAGIVTIAAFISPDEKDRAAVRALFEPEDFVEVFVKCSLEECRRRDPKGLYRKAIDGQIANFTGISAPYDIPEHPQLVVDTERMSVEQCVDAILQCLTERNAVT